MVQTEEIKQRREADAEKRRPFLCRMKKVKVKV